MSYDVVNNRAIIDGANGPYNNGKKAKGAIYGLNAAHNYSGYTKDLECQGRPIKPDIFTREHSPEEMMAEVNRLEKEKMPPINLLLRYAPKKGSISGFFSRLFTGSAVNKQALLGFSYVEMGKKTAITIEEADAPFHTEAYKDIGAKLTAKAFDVNNDGKIDISEQAASTVIADVLSKDDNVSAVDKNLKKADGSYTNDGENKMMAFCNEKNLDAASKIVKNIHKELKLDKAMEKFEKNIS